MELEAYQAYEKFCKRVGVTALPLEGWRDASQVAPMRFASPLMHGCGHNPGYSVMNPQVRIVVSL